MQLSPTVRAIKQALPSVVSIRTIPTDGNDEYAISSSPEMLEQDEMQLGGSGFIVAQNGIIVTNKHVVPETGATYEVILQNGESCPASVLARDPIIDLAFLAIPKRQLRALKLGSAKGLQLGEEVIAIGNAFGQFANTVSNGIVSGLSRSLVASLDQSGAVEELEGLIQTDAAINPGNSGGPLINLKGEAVGINIATVIGAQSLGFAIPIDMVKRDLADLIRFKRIRRGYLGIRYIPITDNVAKEYALSAAQGALIASNAETPAVDPRSPAAKAGIKQNDIILAVNGRIVNKKRPLSAMLAQCRIGRPMKLTILRNSRRKHITITPIEWEVKPRS